VDTTVWEAAEPSLEELLLAHLRSPEAPALLTPSAAAVEAGREVVAV
jgi:ABC-2 type transport system ATP-binding protein